MTQFMDWKPYAQSVHVHSSVRDCQQKATSGGYEMKYENWIDRSIRPGAEGEAMINFAKPDISDAEIDAAARCLRSGMISTGAETAAFEREFSEAIGATNVCAATNSGTAACQIGFAALDLPRGSQVICPSLSFASPVITLLHMGLKPTLCDVDPVTLCARQEDIEACYTNRTRAVMVTHFTGRYCDDMTNILSSNHVVIEDAAHCMPGDSRGDFAFYSFYATKCITTGHGGMLVSKNSDLIGRARKLRLHGIIGPNTDYDIEEPGYKANMPDMAAVIGRVQLRRSQDMLANRQRIAAIYDSYLARYPYLLQIPPGGPQSRHLYVIRVKNAKDFIGHMRVYGIECSVHFKPIHHMSFWKGVVNLPNTEATVNHLVSLPIYSGLSDIDAQYIAECAALSAAVVS